VKAVVVYGKEDFRYEDVPMPVVGDEEVLVRVHKCGICAADPKIFHGKAYFSKVVYDHAPIIAGHEFIGEVVELGKGAEKKYGLEIGDQAIAEQIVPCGECYYCRRGLYNLCDVHAIFGVSGPDGGWAEYMKYPRGSIVWKVPRDLPPEVGVSIEPLACAIHGVERGDIKLEDTVVVMGLGAIGLFMLQVARLKHPRQIIAVDVIDHRLQVARELGADVVLNPAKEDVVGAVKDLTHGIGCDVVLEASGSPKAVESAVDMLRKRGRLVEFGVFAEKTCIDFSVISDIKELEIVGGHLGLRTYPLAIEYLATGLVKTDKINTHDFPLSEWKKAIEVSEKRLENAIKVIMTP
jgi:L-iditol 2-dehydrogenase